MWHQDPSIKAEMLLAFSAVYLTDGAGEHAESLGAAEIASNLMHLVKHCDASEVNFVLYLWMLSLLTIRSRQLVLHSLLF